jgi:DNA-binding response OmpR family regulator
MENEFMLKQVLIVEDEARIAHWVSTYFEREGYKSLVAKDGETGLALAQAERLDLIILDIMLPKLNGIEVCRRIRRDSEVPIIMLTAKDKESDRILGLDSGADDYVVKPFSPNELLARARAILRRSDGLTQEILVGGDVKLETATRKCSVREETIELTEMQFRLLAALMRHHDQILSRQQLLDAANIDRSEVFDRTIDAHIRRLRILIEDDPAKPHHIRTLYGAGYTFRP